MSAFGIIALFLGLVIAFIAAIRIGRTRGVWAMLALLALYVWHTAFCFAYWQSALSEPLDSNVYYWSALQGADPGLGTAFVCWFSLLQMKLAGAVGLDSTFLDQFLLNNVIGYVGLLCVFLALQRATAHATRKWKILFGLVPFMPGLSYWSCAIGKDSFAMLGIGVALLASLSLKGGMRRHLAILLGAAIVFVVRPHIAAVIIGAYGTSMLVQARRRPAERILALVLGAAAAPVALWVLQKYVGIAANSAGLMDFIEARQLHARGGSYIDLTGHSPPYIIFTYLFRPLFFDAPNMMGMAASVENVAILGVVLTCIIAGLRRVGSRELAQVVFTFSFIYFAVGTPLLAFATSNLGLAVRQKSMVLPALYVSLAFIAVGGGVPARRQRGQPVPQRAAPPPRPRRRPMAARNYP